MRRGSTNFLRFAILAIAAVVLAICLFALPAGIGTDEAGFFRPLLIGLYVPAIPFFFALYQALNLLTYIDSNKAFSELSITALSKIKYCAAIISLLFTLGMPYLYYVTQRSDAPGILALGMIIVFASVVIAVFAALLQKLFKSAIALQAENDLTV